MQGSKPKNILFLQFNKLGDALLQTQLFRAAKLGTNAKVIVLGSPMAAPAFQGNPRIDHLQITKHVPNFNPAVLVAYALECIKLIRQYDIDTVVADSVNSTPSSALVMRFLPVKNKIYSNPTSKYPLLQWGMSWVNKGLSNSLPMSQRNLGIAKHLGLSSDLRVELYPSDSDREWAKSIAQECRKSGKPLIAYFPFSRQAATQWPKGHIEELVRELPRKYSVIVFCSPDEKRGLSASGGESENIRYVSESSLQKVFALTSQCDVEITLDTGPAHFFQATQIPLIKICSARQPESIWGYHGDSRYHEVIHKPPCANCLLTVCPVAGHPCMSEIKPMDILSELEKVLD